MVEQSNQVAEKGKKNNIQKENMNGSQLNN